jgi:putative hydroxymethylpyrimidine transport system substrate-binding protein
VKFLYSSLRCLVFLTLFFTRSLFAETQPIKLILDWYLNPDHASLFVAQEKGYFKQEGISVEIIQPADTADGPKLVAAEQADLALTYQPGFMQQVDIGLPLVRVGSLINHPLETILVLKSGPSHDITDLKGKTIGYSNPAADIFMLDMMLRYHHLSLSDVHTVDVRFSLLHALLTGNIDAITGGMRNVEPILMKLNGHPARLFYPEKNGIPPYDELIFVANKKSISDPRLKKFFIALKKGANYLKKHPKASWKAFAKAHPEKGDMSRLSWFASIPYFSQNPTELDAEKYNNFMLFMWKNHAISRKILLSEYAVCIN